MHLISKNMNVYRTIFNFNTIFSCIISNINVNIKCNLLVSIIVDEIRATHGSKVFRNVVYI